MKKWVIRIVVGCAALFVIVLVIVFLSINGIVRYGVERGANVATGQAASLDSASLSIFGGSVELGGLKIDNPPGYSKAKIVAMKNCKATAQVSSLFTNDVVIPEVDIDGLEMSIEQNGLKSNLSDVLAVANSSTSAGGGSPGSSGRGSSAPAAPGRNIHVHVIKLTGTVVHVGTLGQTRTLTMPAIEKEHPTNPDGRPTTLADLTAKILMKVATQIANDPQIPAAFKNGLNEVNAVAGQAEKAVEGDTKDVEKKFGNLFNKSK